MNRAWETVNLGDICRITSSKRIFAKEYRTSGVPFYRGKEIIEKHNGRKVSNELYISKERYEEIRNKFDVPKKGDILLSSVGTLGVAWLVDEDEFYFKDGNLTWLRCNEKMIPGFLYLWLNSPSARNQINAMCIGSTQKALTIETLKKFLVELPPIETQKRICRIIDPISNKIKTNNQINKNLSEQLQALYTSEFDVTVHHATAKLSDICHYSVERVNVDELSTKTYYSTENMQPNKVSSVEATNLPSIKQTTRCHKGDVLVSNIRPYFKKIEYVTTECGCSTDVLCFVPASKDLSAFLYETLYADRFFDYMVAGSKGTKMPRGDKQQIMQYEVVMPSSEQLLAFNAAATPMLALITNGMLENERLSMLRDSLLPRLMSGELDVSDIDF